MTPAYGYVRVSGKGQVEGSGLDRQESSIRRYAGKHDFEIVSVYREEGVSGTKSEGDRPAFQDMMAAILKNGVNTVIVEALDRLARELIVQQHLLIYLASKDVDVIVAMTGENATESIIMAEPMKKALIQMQGVFAELEKNLLVKKLRTARERIRAEYGRCEGRKGYKDLAPELLRQIKQLRRKRKGGIQWTFKQIADKLNEQGLKTATGRAFTANNVSVIYHRMRPRSRS